MFRFQTFGWMILTSGPNFITKEIEIRYLFLFS